MQCPELFFAPTSANDGSLVFDAPTPLDADSNLAHRIAGRAIAPDHLTKFAKFEEDSGAVSPPKVTHLHTDEFGADTVECARHRATSQAISFHVCNCEFRLWPDSDLAQYPL